LRQKQVERATPTHLTATCRGHSIVFAREMSVGGKWEKAVRENSRQSERERNVKVESAQLCVKWWPLLEFPSFWNSISTYFCSAALAWHMSSSLAIPVSQV